MTCGGYDPFFLSHTFPEEGWGTPVGTPSTRVEGDEGLFGETVPVTGDVLSRVQRSHRGPTLDKYV